MPAICCWRRDTRIRSRSSNRTLRHPNPGSGGIPSPLPFVRWRSRYLLASLTIFARFAHDVCSLTLTMFAGCAGGGGILREIGLCCHCEKQGDEAISCVGLPMVIGFARAVSDHFVCRHVGSRSPEIAATPNARLAMTAPAIAPRLLNSTLCPPPSALCIPLSPHASESFIPHLKNYFFQNRQFCPSTRP